MSIHWSAPAWLWPLLPVVAAGAVLWAVAMYRRTRPAVAPRLRRTLTALRAAAFVLLVAAVAAPVVSRLGSDTVPAEVLVVVEDSGSMAVGDAAAGRTRWQQAVRVAALADSLAGAAGHEARVTVLAGNGLGALAPLVAEAEPDARGTDLNALAGQALRRAAGGPVRALVLVSDGQETRSAGPARGAAAAPRAVVVGVGDPQGPADRMIRDLRYPDTVHRGDGIVVELLVDHRPAAAAATGDLRVTLTGPAGVLADTVLAATGGAVPVTLTVPADAEGLLVGELTVSPLDNERFLANNSASLAVDVRRARARVLLLADRPGWDVRFLAQAAAAEHRRAQRVIGLADERVDIDRAVVAEGRRLGPVDEAERQRLVVAARGEDFARQSAGLLHRAFAADGGLHAGGDGDLIEADHAGDLLDEVDLAGQVGPVRGDAADDPLAAEPGRHAQAIEDLGPPVGRDVDAQQR
ncbi:MAG: VWA domain-containing protein, partial [Candidatus Krumholzibacteriia bacterium]